MSPNAETLRRRPHAGLDSYVGKETAATDDESTSSCTDSDSEPTESRYSPRAGGGDAPPDAASDWPSSSPAPLTSAIRGILPWTGLVVWPLMLFLPLVLNHTTRCHYSAVFPRSWYALRGEDWLDGSAGDGGIWGWGAQTHGGRPLRHPLGLSLGISAVAVGHFFLQVYFRLHQQQLLGRTTPIQSRGAVEYNYSEALKNHLCQPGGFLLLGLYLTVTWVFDLLPPSYYSFSGGIQYGRVASCLVCQDFVQFAMHRIEHVAHPMVYRVSHKPHHRYTNPKIFDAFDGSVPDTVIMILIPLFVTAQVVRTCNVWTYMAFGSTYANWLTLIHSEVAFPWEPAFRRLGLGTAADHHVHHKFFYYNFGHLFMWFDGLAGTYRNPEKAWGKEFNYGV